MSEAEAIAPAKTADQGLRLHFSGLFVNFITGFRQLIFPVVAAFFSTRSANSPGLSVAIIGVVVLLSLVFRWIAWMRFRYFIGEDDIRIEKGVFSHNARSIPYERIQDVSIEQRLLARLLNLAEVKFETGGGEKDEAKLSYVTIAEANRLRELVRERKEGVVSTAAAADPSAPVAEPPPIFAMDTRRLLTYGIYSFSLVIFAVLFGAAQQVDNFLPFNIWDFGAWIGLAEDRGVNMDTISHIGMAVQIIGAVLALVGLIFLGLASGIVRVMLRDHGFRLDRTAKGFRRRRGLFTLTDVVMPAHRVQGAIVTTGPIRRRRGWYGLRFVSLAQESKKEEQDYAAAPFAQLGEIWPIVEAAALHEPPSIDTFARGSSKLWWLQVAAIGLFALILTTAISLILGGNFRPYLAFLVLPVIAFVSRMRSRRYRYLQDGAQLYVRNGWWREQLNIVPQIKVQSVELAQGPLSRKLDLATLNFGIAGGTLSMPSLPLDIARQIAETVADRIAKIDYSLSNNPS